MNSFALGREHRLSLLGVARFQSTKLSERARLGGQCLERLLKGGVVLVRVALGVGDEGLEDFLVQPLEEHALCPTVRDRLLDCGQALHVLRERGQERHEVVLSGVCHGEAAEVEEEVVRVQLLEVVNCELDRLQEAHQVPDRMATPLVLA